MARVLIVGCGCRGLELARELGARGHVVRGTTRARTRVPELEAAGVDPHVADPLRLATLTPALRAVTVACWLLGSARAPRAELAALHGPRLRSLLRVLVDSGVRGLVYEAAGSVDPELLAGGARAAEEVRRDWNVPTAVVRTAPDDHAGWLAAMAAAVDGLLGEVP